MCMKTWERAEQLLAERPDHNLQALYEEYLSHRGEQDPMRKTTHKALQRAVWGTDSGARVIALSNTICGCD